MMLSEPAPTSFDLNFSVLGFPVRVHPAFFIMPMLLAGGLARHPQVNTGVGMVIVIVSFFISILVHELGHALAFRQCGIGSRLVLYWMGGLAIPEAGGSWSQGARKTSLSPNEQIFVSLAGPVAGLLLAAVCLVLIWVGGCSIDWVMMGPMPLPDIGWTEFLMSRPTLQIFLRATILINIFLNLFNLLPVYPLDGGQIARQLFIKFDPWSGVRNSVIVSMAVAIFLAVIGFKYGEQFIAFFFGYMAYTNYQMLNQSPGGRSF